MPADTPASRRHVSIVVVSVLSALTLAAFDQTVMATALPAIVGDLGGLSDLPLAVTAYLVASTSSTPLFGRASDLWGAKRMLHVAIALFVCGSLCCAIAQDATALIAARAIQGVGGGGLVATAQIVVGSIVPPRERGRYVPWFTSIYLIASALGPIVGGLIVDHLSWRWIFLINVPVGLIAFAITQRILRLPPVPKARGLDLAGGGLLVLTVGCLVLGTSWGGTRHPWTSPTIVGLGVACVVAAAAFVVRERSTSTPILPFALLRDRTIGLACLASLLLGVTMFGSIFYMPVLFQVVTGASTSSAGLLLAPFMVGMIVGSGGSGRRVTRHGHYRRFLLAGPVLCAGACALIATVDQTTPTALPLVFAGVLGAGFGMMTQLLVVAAQNMAPDGQLGTVTSTVTLSRLLGGAIGTSIFGAIINNRLDASLSGARAADGQPLGRAVLGGGPEAIRGLAGDARDAVVHAFVLAQHAAFRFAVPVMVLCLLAVVVMRATPLRRDSAAAAAEPADPGLG
jgi:EmrB/QacA subfamily drug resistance transporter